MPKLLVAFLVAGVLTALGLSAWALRNTAVPEPEPELEAVPESAAPARAEGTERNGGMAAAELTLLSDRVDRLAERVAALEGRSPARPATGAPAVTAVEAPAPTADIHGLQQEVAALRRQVASLSARAPVEPAKALVEDEEARKAVAGLVQEEFQKARDERRARRRAMGDMVMDEAVNEFASRAGMGDDQVAALYPALTEMREALQESWRGMRRGEKDFAEVRGAVQDARDRMDEKARSVLTDDQYKLYQEEMDKYFSGPANLFRR